VLVQNKEDKTQPDDGLLAPRAACRLLGVTRPTLGRYAAAGLLPGSIRLPGGALRIPAESVRRLLQPGAPESES
jgi:predicted site-specific integrase-resolvase